MPLQPRPRRPYHGTTLIAEDRAWRLIVVGAAGAAWGLGLARFLAEAALWWLFYTSPLAVAGVAVGGAITSALVWRVARAVRPAADVGSWPLFLPVGLPLLYAVGAVASPLAGAVCLLGGPSLTGFLHWNRRPRWAISALLWLVGFSVYVHTLLPSVGEADTLEFQVVVPNLGIAHPTGYPLYVLLAKLFTFLPLRNVAWRVNLASSVFGASAVVVLYGVGRRLIRSLSAKTDALHGATIRSSSSSIRAGQWAALSGLLAALALAFSPTFWSQAIVAEVYTLHILLVALILWLLLGDGEMGRERAGQAGWRRLGLFFLLGLSLTNHLTTALLIPAVLLSLAWDRPSWAAAGWARGAGCFLVGLSVCLFIPLRWPALHDGQWMTAAEFLRYVTGGQFHGALRLDGWRDPTRWRIVARLLHQPFGWPGIVLSVVGLWQLARRRPRALMMTAVTFLAFVTYGLLYYVADVAVFLLPVHVILALWMGVGMACVFELSGAAGRRASMIWQPVVAALLALLPLSGLVSHLRVVDRSRDWGRRAWGQHALSQPLDRNGAILADVKKFAPLYYLQQVEGLRTDLDIVLLGSEELYQRELRQRLSEAQTVYLARYLPGLDGMYLTSVGPLAKVEKEAPVAALGSSAVRANLGNGIELVGAEVEEDRFGLAVYHVTLDWRATRSIDRDLLVRFRLVDEGDSVQWASDGVRPVNQLYPTNAWPPGVPLADYHELSIAPWVPPGVYSLQVGLAPLGGREGPGSEDGGGASSWISLSEVRVDAAREVAALDGGQPMGFRGELWLTGSDVPAEGFSDEDVIVGLAWRQIDKDQVVTFEWRGRDGDLRTASRSRLSAGMVHSRHVVSTPSEPGLYGLRVGLAGKAARCGWLGSAKTTCAVGDVRIRAGKEALGTFGQRIALTEARIESTEVGPGDPIQVDLGWRGLRAIGDDYTVFVHLVGPDGRLHDQVDSWPVQGTYPTSEWRPGTEVRDRYVVRLDADAPDGLYRVELGLYKLETMERLPVLGRGGAPIGDSFLVGQLDVRR